MAGDHITIYDVIVLVLRANKNNYTGRTVLQKLTYFWAVCISPIDEIDYGPHYYGPYSPRLRQAMAEMISYAFMDEGVKSGPAYDSYHYTLSADGKKFAERASKNYDTEYKKFCRIIKACEDSNSLQPNPLSYAAKVNYIKESHSPGVKSVVEIIDCAKELGWDMTKSDVTEGKKVLESIKLAANRKV